MIILSLLIAFIMNAYAADHTNIRQATFAGGCFWCIESAFSELDAVVNARSGFMHAGGNEYEAVEVYFDSDKITYNELVDHYFRQIDPTDAGGQFADRGDSYKPAIFYHNDDQKKIATEITNNIKNAKIFDEKIQVQLIPAGEFAMAAEYHQDYFEKNPIHFQLYKVGSGRAQFLNSVWKNVPKSCTLKNHGSETH